MGGQRNISSDKQCGRRPCTRRVNMYRRRQRLRRANHCNDEYNEVPHDFLRSRSHERSLSLSATWIRQTARLPCDVCRWSSGCDVWRAMAETRVLLHGKRVDINHTRWIYWSQDWLLVGQRTYTRGRPWAAQSQC